MNGAAMLADPEAGLAFAAAELVRRLPVLSGDEALERALSEFRERGVEPLLPAIQKARVAARTAARERNARAHEEARTESERAEEELARLREARRQMVGTPSAARAIVPTPFLWANPARLPRRSWLYGQHLIRGEVSLTLAPGGVGKTSLAAAEVAAMSTGRALLHDHPDRPLRVWWWNGEEPEDEMARRLAGVAKHYRLPPSAFADRLFIDNGNDLPLMLAEQGREGTKICTPVVEHLVEALKARRIDVMLIDPFVSTHNVHENDNSAIQQAASAWKAVAQRAGVGIGLAHHTRKLAGRDASAEDSRGGDALVSKARDARALNPMGEADATRHGIHKHERHSYFSTGTGGKSNMTPKSDRKVWFKLESVGLGNGALNAPEDRVAVVTKWEPPVVEQDLSPLAVSRLADLMGEREWRASKQARGWLGRLVAEAFELGSEDGWEGRARLILKELEVRRIIIATFGQDERRKSVPVYRLGARETAEI
ncbi:AAA family ATPase [Sphingomonas sp. LY29]|uniref:AAA family ATPase n=1 Tax=Sphingomonas sp. LY29 TaxID=3095341 RepID=UPI002D79F2C2|nr:AAA family ATPase [Sphingomonas sp. LY29]WRP25140.1 AAA family ATPase [Sphingomonas sp. LY29]